MTAPGKTTLQPRTPVVRVDRARLQANIDAMAARARAAGAALHPHIKTHKSPAIARMQMAAGAAGITASKPSEAMVFVREGLPLVTIAYPLIDPDVVRSLLREARLSGSRLRFITACDQHLDVLAAAAAETPIEVFVKVDTGLGRVGILPGTDEGPRLARRIATNPRFRYAGLLSHAGHSYGAGTTAARQAIADDEMTAMQAAAADIDSACGLRGVISVGATPTAAGAEILFGTDELRPGNYVFYDMTAVRLGLCRPEDVALSVETTAIFRSGRRVVIDAGSKVLSSDIGPHGTGGAEVGFGAVPVGNQVLTIARLSEEHGVIDDPDGLIAIGDRLRVLPNHSCAVVALTNSFLLDDTMQVVEARGATT